MDGCSEKRVAVIAGGGPAGLTMAYELAHRSETIQPIVYEASDMLGGISRTVDHNGNRIDIGGHRFFSKNARVRARWNEIMPMQGSPARDELLWGVSAPKHTSWATDPEQSDEVMLLRRRISRIYYLRRFFDYPVTLSLRTLRSMGFFRSMRSAAGFIASKFRKLPDTTLENFYINRFGKPLYRMFFEGYTEKVWGVHPSRLGADWGAQRIKGLSISAILRDMFVKKLGISRTRKVETSLIEEFAYPKFGPGQLWELTAKRAAESGAEIVVSSRVEKVHIGRSGRVEAVSVVTKDGKMKRTDCDMFISSMPLCDLIKALDGIDVPEEVRRIAKELPYRDFITVGLLVPELRIKNHSEFKTVNERIPDTWIYVQERDVRLGRIQVFNNWSPYMVKDFENTVWIGLEYFCSEGDEMWNMSDSDFIEMAKRELEHVGMINASDVLDAVRIKVRKAYPSYFGSYYELGKVKAFLNSIPNLYCIGRNGQHRYNNMDHSMLTAMVAADNILNGITDKDNVWNVNTEKEYHESE